MFSISQVFDQSWNVVKNQMPLVAGLTLITGICNAIAGFIPFFGYFLSAPMWAGYLYCLLRIRDGKTVEYSELFWGYQNLNRLIHIALAYLLVVIGVVVGGLLLVLPGIWFFVSSYFTTVFLVTSPEEDSVGAIRKSMELVRGYWWKVFWLLMAMWVLMMLGAACFMVGLLISTPVCVLMAVHAAEALKAIKQQGQIPVGGPASGAAMNSGSTQPTETKIVTGEIIS